MKTRFLLPWSWHPRARNSSIKKPVIRLRLMRKPEAGEG